MNIIEEMSKVIQNNLPQIASQEIISYVKELEEKAKLTAKLQATIAELHSKILEQDAIERKLSTIEQEKLKLKKDQQKLQDDTLAMLKKEARVDAAVADAKANTALEFMRVVFKNPEIKRSAFGSIPVANSSGYPSMHPTNESTTETIE